MRPDDRVRIRHMIEAAEAAQRFIANRQRADLDTDEMLLCALVRAAEIIVKLPRKSRMKRAERCPLFPGSKSSQCAIA
jgi:uncharacterized protein with HEPN domain